jgi:hypothetical protein
VIRLRVNDLKTSTVVGLHFIVLIKWNFYHHYFIDVCTLKIIHVSGPLDSKLWVQWSVRSEWLAAAGLNCSDLKLLNAAWVPLATDYSSCSLIFYLSPRWKSSLSFSLPLPLSLAISTPLSVWNEISHFSGPTRTAWIATDRMKMPWREQALGPTLQALDNENGVPREAFVPHHFSVATPTQQVKPQRTKARVIQIIIFEKPFASINIRRITLQTLYWKVKR